MFNRGGYPGECSTSGIGTLLRPSPSISRVCIGAELAEEIDELPRTPGPTLQLTEFQRLGAGRALRILDRWGGVLVADGVGLGGSKRR